MLRFAANAAALPALGSQEEPLDGLYLAVLVDERGGVLLGVSANFAHRRLRLFGFLGFFGGLFLVVDHGSSSSNLKWQTVCSGSA